MHIHELARGIARKVSRWLTKSKAANLVVLTAVLAAAEEAQQDEGKPSKKDTRDKKNKKDQKAKKDKKEKKSGKEQEKKAKNRRRGLMIIEARIGCAVKADRFKIGLK